MGHIQNFAFFSSSNHAHGLHMLLVADLGIVVGGKWLQLP